jgi:hypothetical protein
MWRIGTCFDLKNERGQMVCLEDNFNSGRLAARASFKEKQWK